MIYYFSGTGNSKWVAEQLAAKTNDTAINIITCTDIPSMDKQTIGFVFPIYAWGCPEPVLNFIRERKGIPDFAYAVCTCGAEAGYAMEKLNDIFPLQSKYSIEMPNNYIMGEDVESEDIIAAKITKAKSKINMIANQVITKTSTTDVNYGRLSWLKSNLINKGFHQFARSTKPFYATDKCNSCGQCARNCPANVITMKNERPCWSQKCYQCTSCINRCPMRAIEYGKRTVNKSRYQFQEN